MASLRFPIKGRITDATGAPIAGPSVSIRFSFWDAATGGTKTWGDQTITTDVVDGRFAVTLGPLDDSGNPLNTSIGSTPHLEIQVGSDAPLPRQEIFSHPRSLTAEVATNADVAVDLAGGLLKTDNNSDRVGVFTQTPQARLHVAASSDASLVDGSGVVQIGDQDGDNLVIDGNEIQARDDAAASTLFVQAEGGLTDIGGPLQVDGEVNLETLTVSGDAEMSDLRIFNPDRPTILLQSDGTSEISGTVALRQSNGTGYDMWYDGVQDELAIHGLYGSE